MTFLTRSYCSWKMLNLGLPISRHLEHTKKKLKVMLSITYGMIRIFGDSTVTRLFTSAFRTTRSNRSFSFVIRHPKATITNQVGWPKKYSTVDSIGPPFSETLTNMSQPANSVNEQEYPNSQFYFVKSLTYGVLISWAHSLSPMETLIFCLPSIMCRDGWRLKPPRLMMLNLVCRKLLLVTKEVTSATEQCPPYLRNKG
ncbi:hypothetical protein CR513_03844, partial [Mucuna pruriens]